MERIWAPWRLAYVEQAGNEPECILCAFPAERRDHARFILYQGEHGFVILNAYPYSNGHLMVAPYRHTANIEDLESEEGLAVLDLVRMSVSALKEAYHPHGFNIGMNLGRVAGAGIEDHLHVHVVPRWNGDTNFMAVVGDTRVIPASLEATYERLAPYFRPVEAPEA
jgi:ATP adenylyltransferase